MAAPMTLSNLDVAVDTILKRVPGNIVLAIPLGLGKPNPLVNALYRRIKASPQRNLTIFTALSLEKPEGKSELERLFLAPLVERVFGDYPDLDYVKDSRAGTLPDNIKLYEFFFKTGDYLGNAVAQRHHVCTNYTMAAREMSHVGVNVIAQAVAVRDGESGRELSFSCNPDLTQDLVDLMSASGAPLLKVAVINKSLPFMSRGAIAPPDFFDLVVDDPAGTHDLFAPPNASIGWADYAIGLHASSLVVDGGTLQIGIGSLGDAIAQSLIVRDKNNTTYQQILESLCQDGLDGRETAPFQQGLYGCSEMFVNGFIRLIDAELIRRPVYPDLALQRLANEGRVGPRPSVSVLQDLLAAGRIQAVLTAADLVYLQGLGLLRPGIALQGGALQFEGKSYPSDLHQAGDWTALLGDQWIGATIMHGGFFLGPRDFYQRLRDLPEPMRERIDMTRISHINQLYGDAAADEALKRAQRGKARLMNTTMKMTLLGAAASDALESSQVVSGVGGQYNFVAMAHALPDARSVLMLRATHDNKDGLKSNIVWNYGHVTIPRHLRDVVITEYGVADLRGRPDEEVVQRLLAIADSRFQDELIKQAQAHGKLSADYKLPQRYRNNLPEALREKLRPWRNEGILPDFPFGTDLTDDELHIVRALKKLKYASTHPVALVGLVLRSLVSHKRAPEAYLHRMGLDEAQGFKQLFMRRLFSGNL